MMQQYSHIFFDLDGVIIDSEIKTLELLQAICQQNGLLLPNSTFQQRVGKKISQFVFEIPQYIPSIKAQTITSMFYDVYEKNPIDYYNPIEPTLAFIKNHHKHYSFVLTTMSSYLTAKKTLNQLKIDSLFAYIFSSENIKMPKPNPEIYTYAIERLKLSKKNVAVIEDSIPGIQAALAASLDTFVFQNNKNSYQVFEHISGSIQTLQDYEHYFGSRS